MEKDFISVWKVASVPLAQDTLDQTTAAQGVKETKTTERKHRNAAELERKQRKELSKADNAAKKAYFKGIMILIVVLAGMVALKFAGEDYADEGSAQDLLQKAYSKLGLPMSATDDQVRARFKELAIKMHPDKCSDCHDEFVEVQRAKEFILQEGKYFKARMAVDPSRIPTYFRQNKPRQERENPF